MDTQHCDQVPSIDEFEHKADELISLMLSLCEKRIRRTSAMPEARASSLAYTVMTAQNAMRTFLALARIR